MNRYNFIQKNYWTKIKVFKTFHWDIYLIHKIKGNYKIIEKLKNNYNESIIN